METRNLERSIEVRARSDRNGAQMGYPVNVTKLLEQFDDEAVRLGLVQDGYTTREAEAIVEAAALRKMDAATWKGVIPAELRDDVRSVETWLEPDGTRSTRLSWSTGSNVNLEGEGHWLAPWN
jgi:hypothetical protein